MFGPLVSWCRLSLGLVLPPLAPEVLEVVVPLLVVAPRRVEGGDGGVGPHPRHLDHPAAHQVARPVEAVSAVNTYQARLGPRALAHSREEFFHNFFVWHNTTRNKNFPVNQAELLTLPRLIISVSVCEVNDHLQVRNNPFKLLQIPLFILT